jgi:bis(5'-nucleosyl)-tetraphosphatase (symmetrical)
VAVYAIGDVQGCYTELKQLLEKISFNSDNDQLWFTGDLVNRGPDSLATLRLIRSFGESAITVLGNHDLHLLAIACSDRKPNRKDTLTQILEAPDRLELMRWLRNLPLIHTDDSLGFTMVHAGLHPDWSVSQAQALAREVETVLRSDDHKTYYKHMYGDKPHNWSDKLRSWPRLRFITNIFTRLRYCTDAGEPGLNVKGAPGTQPANMHPWFEIRHRASREQRIVFGHWSTLPVSRKHTVYNVYPLDTGCLLGGKLTALRIDSVPFETTRIDCPQTSQPGKKSPVETRHIKKGR